MMTISRRNFVRGSLTAAAGLPLLAHGRARGANERVRVAVCGVRGRGRTHIDWVEAVEGASVVAIVDPDRKVLEKRAQFVEKHYGRKPDTYADYRRMLERDDIDAVTIATPNHLHSLIGIEAVRAGKDVYVEKPVSHDIWEGRQLVNAARKHNKIVQTGTQARSSHGLQQTARYVHEGHLGPVRYAVGTCYKSRTSIDQRETPLEIPGHIDYELWCGPAKKEDLYRRRLHYDWHWNFNTGNGDIGNQGVHQMDLARWVMGETRPAKRVLSVGGRVGYDDAGNTPNTLVAYLECETAPLIFEVRGLPKSAKLRNGKGGGWNNNDMDRYRGANIGAVVQCEGGYVLLQSYHSAKVYDNDGNLVESFSGGGDHMANFVNAVRSRKRQDLSAEIEEGHTSSALCHQGNVPYRLGQKMSAERIESRLTEEHEVAESFSRMFEHLRANNVPIDEKTLTMGPALDFDTERERFTGEHAAEANAIAHPGYRKPFVVPDLSGA